MSDLQVPSVRPFQFTLADMQAEIDAKLAEIPPDRKGVVIAHADLNGNGVLSAAIRAGDHWSVLAEGFKRAGDYGGGVEVRFEF